MENEQMTAKTSMTIRTDRDVKMQAQHLFSNLGLDMSTAINLFLRQSIQHQGLPFDITLRQPNQTTLKAIEESYNKTNKSFDSVDELMKELNA